MEIITTKEAAAILHQHPATVQKDARNGEYPSNVVTKHGRIYLWQKEELVRYLFLKKEDYDSKEKL